MVLILHSTFFAYLMKTINFTDICSQKVGLQSGDFRFLNNFKLQILKKSYKIYVIIVG